jgi:hypothetical protein
MEEMAGCNVMECNAMGADVQRVVTPVNKTRGKSRQYHDLYKRWGKLEQRLAELNPQSRMDAYQAGMPSPALGLASRSAISKTM